MYKAYNVGRDEVLTTEQALYIRQKAVEAARRTFQGRKLFGNSVLKIDSSAQTYGYDTRTHGSAAAFDWHWPGKNSIDAINFARSQVPIPNIHKEFDINKLDLAASQMGNGSPLNVSQAESAAYLVAYFEDTVLLMGYTADGTNYDINGLYKAASNTKAGSDWATATNIPATINGAIQEMITDNITGPYNIILSPEQYTYTSAFIGTSAVTYRQWIEQEIKGTVSWSPVFTAGTGLMSKADPEGMFELVVAEDISTETERRSIEDGGGLFGRVYVRDLPVVYDGNALCTMTGLT
jgi:uncharacterized linocin/CFP29 family protein